MRKLILFISLITLLASCKNLVPFTDAMKKQHNWSNEQVKRIQFYVSRDIVLHRELTNGSTEIVGGKIKTIRGKKVDEILIQAGTKGVVTARHLPAFPGFASIWENRCLPQDAT